MNGVAVKHRWLMALDGPWQLEIPAPRIVDGIYKTNKRQAASVVPLLVSVRYPTFFNIQQQL